MRHRLVFYYDDTGEKVSQWYPIDEAPPDRISVADKEFRLPPEPEQKRSRLAGRFQIMADEKPHVSHAAPRWHGVAEGKGRGYWDSYDKSGRPVISSRSSYKEAVKRAADNGEIINRVMDTTDG